MVGTVPPTIVCTSLSHLKFQPFSSHYLLYLLYSAMQFMRIQLHCRLISRPLTRLRMACVLFSLGLILTTSTTSLADPEPLLGDPDLSKVNFYLWTPENPVDHQEVQLDLVSLLESNFDPARPTKILSHGWNSHGRGYGQDFAPIFLEVGDFNIFSIDWGDLESWISYPTAAIRTTAVGRHAAGLVQLMVEAGSTLADVHLVGHSLGAHVVGFLGKKVQDLGLGKVARVTGLDPAKPLFELANATGRIDRYDWKERDNFCS